jgi:hypothetical protein
MGHDPTKVVTTGQQSVEKYHTKASRKNVSILVSADVANCMKTA